MVCLSGQGDDLILGWQITITAQRRLTRLLTATSNLESTQEVSKTTSSRASLVSVGSLHGQVLVAGHGKAQNKVEIYGALDGYMQ